jgi:hypothetical protein
VKKTKLTVLTIVIAASTQIVNAMLYNPNQSDLLLLFRSDSYTKNVEVDIGSVTNLINLAAGTVTNFSSVYSTNQVKTNFGNAFSAVVFTVAGSTASTGGHGNALWFTSASGVVPTNVPINTLNPIRNQVLTIGGDAAAATGSVAGSNYVGASTAPQSYSAVLGGNYGTFGGLLSFTDEALAGNTQNFYQLGVGTGPGVLIGTFSMSSVNGAVTFTRANTVVPLVPAQIVGVVRTAGSTQISFTTTNGNNYQLLYRTNLLQGGWVTNAAAGTVTGNNATNVLNDATTDPQRFYRIQSF